MCRLRPLLQLVRDKSGDQRDDEHQGHQVAHPVALAAENPAGVEVRDDDVQPRRPGADVGAMLE